MNSRSQINPTPAAKAREKLDTVHQNNSEVSLREQPEQPLQVEPPLEDTFRRGAVAQETFAAGSEEKPVLTGESMVQREEKPY